MVRDTIIKEPKIIINSEKIENQNELLAVIRILCYSKIFCLQILYIG
jgi:hypothetical protein